VKKYLIILFLLFITIIAVSVLYAYQPFTVKTDNGFYVYQKPSYMEDSIAAKLMITENDVHSLDGYYQNNLIGYHGYKTADIENAAHIMLPYITKNNTSFWSSPPIDLIADDSCH
jgi:hypothetical protein